MLPLMGGGGILTVKCSIFSSLLTSIFLALFRFIQQKISWNHVVISAMILLAAGECQWHVVKSIWTLRALFSFTVELLKGEWITLGRYLYSLQIREKGKQYKKSCDYCEMKLSDHLPLVVTPDIAKTLEICSYRNRSYSHLQETSKHPCTAQRLHHMQLKLGAYLAGYLR